MSGALASGTTFFDLAKQLASEGFRGGKTAAELRRFSDNWLDSLDATEKPRSLSQAHMQGVDLLTNGIVHAAAALAVQPDTREGAQQTHRDDEVVTVEEILTQIERIKAITFEGWEEGRGRTIKTFPTSAECKIARFMLENLSGKGAHEVPLYDLTQVGKTQLMVPVEPLKKLARMEGIELTMAAGREGGVAGKIGV